MKRNSKLALYIAYYLSRFNEEGLQKLGYETWKQAYEDISLKLDININTIKNRRDEFDPIHGHRAGWHQRTMSPSRVNVVKALEDLDEIDVRGIVLEILKNGEKGNSENIDKLIKVTLEDSSGSDQTITSRGRTGVLAEKFFIESFHKDKMPEPGELRDTRDLGCGYDFEILNDTGFYCVEVKGLSGTSESIVFTEKEWKVARYQRNHYILCVVDNVYNNPTIKFLYDPASELTVTREVEQVLQVRWSASVSEIIK